MTQTQASRAILREAEYAALLREASQECGSWIAAALGDATLFEHPGAVARFSEASHGLETFLDDHGARQNQTFVTLGELVASVRGLAGVKLKLLHLVVRLPRYPTVSGHGDLRKELEAACSVVTGFLQALCRRLSEEAKRLGLHWGSAVSELPVAPARPRQLPRNLDVDMTVGVEQHLAEIGGRLLSILEASRGLNLDRIRGPEELSDYVAQHASEDRCRWYESAAHNIQSMYDTHVAGTALEGQHPWLAQVRGHASICYHLLETATELIHFYERHENDLRYEPATSVIAAAVSKQEILSIAVNTCLRQAYQFVESCSGLVDEVLRIFVTQQSTTLSLPDGVTLHARPLALIVQVARHFGTPVEISIGGEACSAASLMGLIMLAGKHPGAREVMVSGDSRALSDLRALFDAGLGESREGFPPELEYLRLTS